jgi:hypothetical protein
MASQPGRTSTLPLLWKLYALPSWLAVVTRVVTMNSALG